MKIDKLILKNMLIVAGLSLAFGCKNTPVTDSAQSNTTAKPAEILPEQTQSLPNETKPNLNDPVFPRKYSHDYCPPCGKG